MTDTDIDLDAGWVALRDLAPGEIIRVNEKQARMIWSMLTRREWVDGCMWEITSAGCKKGDSIIAERVTFYPPPETGWLLLRPNDTK